MAAAGLYSDLYSDLTRWDNADAPYATLCDTLGYSAGAVCLDHPQSRMNLVNLSVRTPVAVVFVSAAESDFVYVAHSLTMFPTDLTEPTAMDLSLIHI
jgi:hypothetical protein